MLLAYLRSHAAPHTLHVPLANLARDDLRLRPELQVVLSGGGSASAASAASAATVDDLITLSELPADLTAADSRWLLVDHNALTGDLARRFAASVVGCIDHHVDEGVVPEQQPSGRGGDQDGQHGEHGNMPRIIEPCGSCASLVVRAGADGWKALAAQTPDVAADRLLARVAVAPVLIDTTCLDDAAKTTDVDRQAVALAETWLLPAGEDGEAYSYSDSYSDNYSYSRRACFAELARRKEDLTGFTYDDVLRKDYKQWHEHTSASAAHGRDITIPIPITITITLGIASAVQGLEYLLGHIGDREALLAGLRRLAAQRRLDVVALMTVQQQQHDDAHGRFARQLLLWARSDVGAAAAQAFVHAHAATLGLEPWDGGSLDDTTTTPGQWRRCWWQRQTRFSRKQVAPYLREAMRSVGGEVGSGEE